MQLGTKLSLFAALSLGTVTLQAENYVNVQFIGYDEDSGRTTIFSPQVEIAYDYGVDYAFDLSFGVDSISGASPTFYDAASGASASSRGSTTQENVVWGDVPYDDVRKFASLSVTKRLPSRDEVTMGLSYSGESDYYSGEVSGEYLHYLDSSKNQSVTIGAAYQKNQVLVPCYEGNSECDAESGASQKFDIDVFNAEVGFTQIIDKNSLAKISFFAGKEDGFLSNPYMNVVRYYDTSPIIEGERKPDTRTSYGLTLSYARALGENVTVLGDYRYYSDDWDIDSHTINTEINYDPSETWGFNAGFRYYTQTAAKFYSGKKDYFTDQKYASSDRRMSAFDAFTYKVNTEYRLRKDTKLNVGVTYYDQPDWFDAIYYTIGVKYDY